MAFAEGSERLVEEETRMAWETPVVVEIAVGLEVTSYSSADDEDIRP